MLTSEEVGTTASPQTYVNSLKAGASLTIPSLQYSTDKTEDRNGFYVRHLTGSYANSGQKVYLIQSVVLKDRHLYNVTASYGGDMTTEKEIGQIVEEIISSSLLMSN